MPPLRLLIAPDSFKDALAAPAVAEALAAGARRAHPDAEITLFPLADGGEGTFDVLALHSRSRIVPVTVGDPLGRPIAARYALSADGQTAIVELAQASGLQLLRREERNPLFTSTYGTGELIRHAVGAGAKKIILGIGSSATNDGGIGMAVALGYRFLDQAGRELAPMGNNLPEIASIDSSGRLFAPGEVEVTVICDVDNPLYGPCGAAQTYARQKGADEAAVLRLDAGLRQLAGVLTHTFGRDVSEVSGAGAAGGMGAGALSFLGATLRPGIELVMELTGFEDILTRGGFDLALTGEGMIDAQTLHGKLVQGVAKRAARHGIPTIGVCGKLEANAEQIDAMGLLAAFSIQRGPIALEQAIEQTTLGLQELAFNLLRLRNPGPGF